MTPLVAALSGALVVAGLLGLVTGPPHRSAGTPTRHRRGRPPGGGPRWLPVSRPTRLRLLLALIAGLVIAVLTGFVLAVLILPVAVVGLPYLLRPPTGGFTPDRLQALEEWTRGLSGRLTVGMGLDTALRRSLNSAPQPIRVEVTHLVNRLYSGWDTDRALRVFADELDDEVSDFIAMNLVLAAANRGPGLAPALDGIATSVAATVRARREIEADRQKPRTTATVVTAISAAVLGYMFLNGSYIEPYTTALGQLILLSLGTVYVAILVWMRSMSRPPRSGRLLVSGATTQPTWPGADGRGGSNGRATGGGSGAGRTP